MKKIRRIFTALLFINFFGGMANGMKAGNLLAIVINGVVALAIISAEKKER